MATILVVDDEPRICDLLAACFGDEGYETRRACHGLAVLQEIIRAASI